MTRYFKQLNEAGELALLLTYDFAPTLNDPRLVEITAEEYEALSTQLSAVSGEKVPKTTEVTANV